MRTQSQVIAQIQQMFARCPLTNAQILALYGDFSDDEIFSIGSDIAAGFTLLEARKALRAYNRI